MTPADRYGLIIGISEYPDLGKLKKAASDARALAEILRDSELTNFASVDLVINVSAPTMRTKIARFLKDRHHDDLVLIYFAGHGVRDEDTGALYFAAANTEK